MGEGLTNPVAFVNKVGERVMNLYIRHHVQEGGVFVHGDSKKYNLLLGLMLVEFIDQRFLAVTRVLLIKTTIWPRCLDVSGVTENDEHVVIEICSLKQF